MIKLTCPACSQVIEGPDAIISEAQVTCPTCHRQWPPSQAKRADAVIIAPPAPSSPPRTEPERIADMANRFGGIALVCAFCGGLAVVIGMVSIFGTGAGSNNSAGGSSVCWLLAGALFGLALTLFLISQIIHIRALLARKP